MKQLFENWKRYLNEFEEPVPPIDTEETKITPPDVSLDPPARTGEESQPMPRVELEPATKVPSALTIDGYAKDRFMKNQEFKKHQTQSEKVGYDLYKSMEDNWKTIKDASKKHWLYQTTRGTKVPMPTDLLFGIIFTESKFNKSAYNKSTASGIMQMKPIAIRHIRDRTKSTYEYFKDKKVKSGFRPGPTIGVWDPKIAIPAGAWLFQHYLNTIKRRMQGHGPGGKNWSTKDLMPVAIAAYNLGSTGVFKKFPELRPRARGKKQQSDFSNLLNFHYVKSVQKNRKMFNDAKGPQ